MKNQINKQFQFSDNDGMERDVVSMMGWCVETHTNTSRWDGKGCRDNDGMGHCDIDGMV